MKSESNPFSGQFTLRIYRKLVYKFSQEFEQLVLDLIENINNGKIKALDLNQPFFFSKDDRPVYSIVYKDMEIWISNIPYAFAIDESGKRTSWKTAVELFQALKSIFNFSEKKEGFLFKAEDIELNKQIYKDLLAKITETDKELIKKRKYSNEWLECYVKSNHAKKDYLNFTRKRYRKSNDKIRCDYCGFLDHDESQESCLDRRTDASKFRYYD